MFAHHPANITRNFVPRRVPDFESHVVRQLFARLRQETNALRERQGKNWARSLDCIRSRRIYVASGTRWDGGNPGGAKFWPPDRLTRVKPATTGLLARPWTDCVCVWCFLICRSIDRSIDRYRYTQHPSEKTEIHRNPISTRDCLD